MNTRVIAIAGMLVALSAASTAQAATYYFHADHLGTPQVVTNQDANVVWRAEYRPFGEVEETVSVIEQNLRFPGQYYDRETGCTITTLGHMIRRLDDIHRRIRSFIC